MSSYTYNDLALQYCRTLEYSMEPDYDETGTDMLWTKHTIRVKGILSESQGSFPTNGSPLSSFTLASIKDRLETPRKRLVYRIGADAQVVVGVPPDDKLGPHPLPCHVTEVNTGIFMVECGVIVHLTRCDNECPGERDPVVSVRWTQTESFNESWYSRLKTKGRLVVRASLLQCADNFRPLMTPTVLPDYRRISASYTLSADGTEMDFEFDDQEEDRLPPGPAIKAAGTYTVVNARPGVNRVGTVVITLEGPKGGSRAALMNKAILMGYSKLNADKFQTTPPILWGQFDEDLFVPKVKISMSALMTPIVAKGFIGGAVALAVKATGVVPPPAVMPSCGLLTEGLAVNQPGLKPPERKRLARLLAAAFRDPCACVTAETELTSTGSPPFPPPNPAIVDGTPTSAVVTGAGTGAGASITVAAGPLGAPGAAAGGDYSDTAPYDTYDIEVTTEYDSGLVQLPGTGVGPNGNVSKIVSAHGGMMRMITSWVAGRTGAAPQLPTFQSPDPNIVPLAGRVVAKDVKPAPDNTLLTYLVAGYYIHAILDPSRYSVKPAVAPFLNDSVIQGAELATNFWTNQAVWAVQQGAGQGGAQPFLPNGVTVGSTPTPPSGFDPANPVASDTGASGFDTGTNQNSGAATYYAPPVGP